MLLALKDSPVNSAFVVENLCGQFKHMIRSVKLEKLGNFYTTTWLIFAGPVTYLTLFVSHDQSVCFLAQEVM